MRRQARFYRTPQSSARNHESVKGAIVVLSVEGWRCERRLTALYCDDKHLPAAQRHFLRFFQDERPFPGVR